MSILAGDIKLIASQVMDDVPEGGGAPTANVIADAVSNAVFNDISELDRAGGRVNLRKLFVGVDTANRDGYFGANVIVAQPPADPNVNVTIFSTADTFDRRLSASSRMEAYLNAGPEWPGFLYENHIEGQRSIQLFTRTNVAPPPVGRTILLRMNEGTGTEYEQYVRITRTTVEERTFTIPATATDYQALIVTCDISDALRYDFPGTAANREFTRSSIKTLTRDTVVANAAAYAGASPLSVAADIGDTEIVVESVYAQVVPNARTETPLLDQLPSGQTSTVIATTPRNVVVPQAPYSQRVRVGQENRGFTYVTIVAPLPSPGTVSVTYRALGVNYRVTDNGDGTMSGDGSGTVNYTTGSISVTLQALPDDRSAVVFYWGQRAHFTNQSGSVGFRLPEHSFELANKGVVPGSVTIEWLSGGVLKTATANSAGVISGDATGEINHAMGLVYIRPSAMIDPSGEFSVDYQWSTVVEEAFPGLVPDSGGIVAFTLAQAPVAGSLEIQWVTTREVSETSGVTTSEGSATKDTGTSSGVSFVNSTSPIHAPLNAITYSGGPYSGPPSERSISDPAYWNGPTTTVTTKVPVTVTRQSSASDGSSYTTASKQSSRTSVATAHVITDNGAGGLYDTMGTVGYVSKAVTVRVVGDWAETAYESNYENASNWESLNGTTEPTSTAGGGAVASATNGGGGSTTARGGATNSTSVKDAFASNSLVVRYKTGTITPTSATETFTPPAVVIDLCPYTRETIVPGSVRFLWMGVAYEDFEGRLYRGRTESDPGVHAGAISYTTGVVTLFDYTVSGSASAFTLQSLWTRKPRGHIANATFGTAIAPVKPGGLTISVLDVEGTQIIATANTSGSITGAHTRGTIDFETGLVEIQFGDYVLDSGLSAEQKAEWWYDADDVRTADGKIWKPWPVDPETLRYSAVGYFYLPLDASILGLDPVRLPQDGRVPIYRSGGFVVLGHTGSVGPATVSNGQVINCGRPRLSRVRVIGNDGQVISSGYTQNLTAGTVTFTNVSGYSQPVTVEHRVEDMAMVADVQINGRLRLTREVSHDYPAPGSYVSSALIAGDLRARVSALFDQVTWTSVWSDAQIGSAATGTFNDIANPVVVTNAGAITERWAIIFTNTTTFNVVGEHVGVIAVGNTSADCAPLNPASGAPYFSIPAAGWGAGWSTGNVLRMNTVGAYYPLWAVRTIQPGVETVTDDSFLLLIRGDVDAA